MKPVEVSRGPISSERLYEQAWALMQDGEFGVAQDAFETLIARSPAAEVEADARSGLAGALHAQGLSTQAASQLYRALAVRERMGDATAVGRTYNNLGILNLELGNIGLATEQFEASRKRLSGINQDALLVQVLVNLSHAHGEHDDQMRSEFFALEGLALLKTAHLMEDGIAVQARSHAALELNLAESLRRQGRAAEARDHYETVLCLTGPEDLVGQLSRARHGLALLKAQAGHPEEAMALMRSASESAKRTQDVTSQVWELTGMAELHDQSGDRASALNLAQEALELAQGAGRRLEVLKVHDLLCVLLTALGRPQEALVHLGAARRLEREIKSSENEGRITLMNTLYDLERVTGEREAAHRARTQAELKIQDQVDELQRLALYDALTALPNRTLFQDRLQQAVEAGALPQVGVLDLDRFKHVNDALGREAGDALLRHVAVHLSAALQPGETLARSGGNEYLLLAYGDPEAVAVRFLTALSAEPMRHGGHEVVPRGSLGVASADAQPARTATAITLMQQAESALHHAKRTQSGWTRFDGTQRVTPLALDGALQLAYKERQFVLHHQPQIDARSGAVVGVETLIRWLHPERGLVPPGEFIPALEESNLILEVGAWVLREACHQIAPLGDLRVSVNLSVRQFQQGEALIDLVESILAETGLAAERLELELTESLVMRNAKYAGTILDRLRALGVRVSIDDFGTGHSSLAYLRHFALDALKIDRAFIRELEGDVRDRAIVDTIVHLAHGLGLEVVAEGIETENQAQIARDLGVDLMQGWLYARAMPLTDLKDLLKQPR